MIMEGQIKKKKRIFLAVFFYLFFMSAATLFLLLIRGEHFTVAHCIVGGNLFVIIGILTWYVMDKILKATGVHK